MAIPGLVDTRAGISLDPLHYNWKSLPIKSIAGDLILEPARRIAQEKAWDLPAKRVKIVPSALGQEAGVIGVATLILKQVFYPEENYIHGLRLAL